MQSSLGPLHLVEALAQPESTRTRGLHGNIFITFCLGQPLSEGSVRFADLAQVLLDLQLRERLTILRQSDLDVEGYRSRVRYWEDEPLVLAVDPLALRLILLLLITRPHGIRSLKIRSSLVEAALIVGVIGLARVVHLVVVVLLITLVLVAILVRSLLEAASARPLVHEHVGSAMILIVAIVVIALISLVTSLSGVAAVLLIFPLVVLLAALLLIAEACLALGEGAMLIIARHGLRLLEIIIALLLVITLRVLRVGWLVIVV